MLIVWDFNGTLLSDVSASMGATDELLVRRALPPVAGEAWYREHFHFPIEEYYREIGFSFESESYADVAVEWAAVYRERSRSCGLMPGVREALAELKAAGHRQAVVSASEAELLREQIAHLGISDYFDRVCGLGDAMAHSKLQLAADCIEQSGYTAGEVLFAGDTSHDADAAEAVGSSCALISGGHESERRLRRRLSTYSKGYILNSAAELPALAAELVSAL